MPKTIFDDTKIKNMTLKNRIIRAAIGDHYCNDGHYSQKDFEVYEQLAKGGVGTIITGYAYVFDYPMFKAVGMFGIYDDSFIPEYKKLTDMVHKNNANIVLQIVHCGSYVYDNYEKIYAPSAILNLNTQKMPTMMAINDIKRIENDFILASSRAKESGFDGIEIHAGHGFLLSQFLTPYYNKRNDEYGGNIENRARMLVEIINGVKEKCGKDFPVFVKINCQDGIKEGISEDDFLTVCKMLENNGADLIEVTGNWLEFKQKTPYFLEQTKNPQKVLIFLLALWAESETLKIWIKF